MYPVDTVIHPLNNRSLVQPFKNVTTRQSFVIRQTIVSLDLDFFLAFSVKFGANLEASRRGLRSTTAGISSAPSSRPIPLSFPERLPLAAGSSIRCRSSGSSPCSDSASRGNGGRGLFAISSLDCLKLKVTLYNTDWILHAHLVAL